MKACEPAPQHLSPLVISSALTFIFWRPSSLLSCLGASSSSQPLRAYKSTSVLQPSLLPHRTPISFGALDRQRTCACHSVVTPDSSLQTYHRLRLLLPTAATMQLPNFLQRPPLPTVEKVIEVWHIVHPPVTTTVTVGVVATAIDHTPQSLIATAATACSPQPSAGPWDYASSQVFTSFDSVSLVSSFGEWLNQVSSGLLFILRYKISVC